MGSGCTDSDGEEAAMTTSPLFHASSGASSDHLGLRTAVQKFVRLFQETSRGLSVLPPYIPDVVLFRVGGEDFALGKSFLLEDPQSVLFLLACDHYKPEDSPTHDKYSRGARSGQRDSSFVSVSEPIVMDDKDPMLFRMLINFLRGYPHAIPDEWRDACRTEAEFYGLQKSWHQKYPPSPDYQFSSPLRGTRFLSEMVCATAGPGMTTGEYTIDFAIPHCDRVAVGVMFGTEALQECDICPTGFLGALYWSDGKVTVNVGSSGAATRTDTGVPYPTSAVIRVILDADERLVRWMLNGDYCVSVQRLPENAAPFTFAAVASRISQVNILPS